MSGGHNLLGENVRRDNREKCPGGGGGGGGNKGGQYLL